MSPILKGVVASQITGHLNPYATGSYESIQTISVGSNVQTVQFTSIPQTYKHLEIRGFTRDTYTNTYPGIYATIGGSSGTFNYMGGDGGGGVGGVGGAVSAYTGNSVGNDQTAGNYMPMIIRIPDYTNTSRIKMMNNMLAHSSNGATNTVSFWTWSSGSTAAVTDVLFGEGDTNFKLMPGSHWALYGIKG